MAKKINNVLVTGGAGFIGSHISDDLISKGLKVRVLDNLSTGFERNVNPKAEFIQGDIRERDIVRRAVKGIDLIYHQAAQINPAKAVIDPLFDFDVNVKGTLNVILEAKRVDVKRIVFASTNVYGNAEVEEMHEDFSTLAFKNTLLSPYAAAKVAAEAYLKVANDELGIETVTLRYTNVYGPRQLSKSESGVIAIFVREALKGNSLKIFGTGKKTRDFVNVRDVVCANSYAGFKQNIAGEVFNVGLGEELSILELATIIRHEFNNSLKIEFHAPRAADFNRIKPSLKKSKDLLGYEPQVKFIDGLREYIDWCKANINKIYIL